MGDVKDPREKFEKGVVWWNIFYKDFIEHAGDEEQEWPGRDRMNRFLKTEKGWFSENEADETPESVGENEAGENPEHASRRASPDASMPATETAGASMPAPATADENSLLPATETAGASRQRSMQPEFDIWDPSS